MPAEPQVRGLCITRWLQSFERLHGEPCLQAVHRRLPADLAEALACGLQAQGWYPLPWFRQLCAISREVTGEGIDVIRRVANDAALAELSGIHRILLLLVRPRGLLRRAGRDHARHYSRGSLSATLESTHQALAQWRDCEGFDQNVWEACFVACRVALTACGARSIEWSVLCGAGDRDDHADVRCAWR